MMYGIQFSFYGRSEKNLELYGTVRYGTVRYGTGTGTQAPFNLLFFNIAEFHEE